MLKRFPRNIWVLLFCQSLNMASAPLMVLVSGLLGTHLAPDPRFATLPLALLVVGTASSAIPAAILLQRFGRKGGTLFGYLAVLLGLLACMLAAMHAVFILLLAGAFFIGISLAFMQQLRFAAIESLEHPNDIGPAISLLMLGGVVAAFLGPELGVLGKDWLPSPYGYAGSFLLLILVLLVSFVVFVTRFENPVKQIDPHAGKTRALAHILKNPLFIIAVMAAAIGYGVMSFIMTATPISMHEMSGHSLADTKWVIQSHIAAMFLPSLATGWLIRKFGIARLLMAGTAMFGLTIALALAGYELMHYWLPLILLGIGWNFLFVGGTTLLPQSYQGEEGFKAQAANDFIVFGIQAIASLSAGWVLFQLGWSQLLMFCVPFIALMFIAACWLWLIHKNVADLPPEPALIAEEMRE